VHAVPKAKELPVSQNWEYRYLKDGIVFRLGEDGNGKVVEGIPKREGDFFSWTVQMIEAQAREDWQLISFDWQGAESTALFRRRLNSANEPEKVETMRRWEYLSVYVDDDRYVLRVNNETRSIVKNREMIHDFMNRKGEQGWELVSHATWSGPQGASNYYSFKRPVS
jgi:hypothetical protein